MSIQDKKKPNFIGHDFNNLPLVNVERLQLNQDASSSDEAVRKSQAEQISADAVQAKLVSQSSNASADTAFTSASMVSFLASKQDNLSIHSSSTAYAELVGSELRFKQLLITRPYIDSVSSTLSSYLTANPSNGLEEGDVLILTQATTNQQRTWIHNGGTAGDETDFTRLVTDYNEASIRAMLSNGDTFIEYDNASGQISLNRGTGSTDLGAQTLPVDSTEFTAITGSTALAIMKALETLIINVDNSATGGTATVNTRLDSLSGVSGNNLGSFNGSTFSANKNIKQTLQESEAKHESADSDRSSIRSEFASADTSLDNKINAETLRAQSAEASEASARQSADSSLQSQINSNSSAISNEASVRSSADSALDGRLNIVEGTGIGSISKAEQDAKAYADILVANEAVARQQEDANLNAKIDNLAEGDITFVGEILSNGTLSIRAERITAGDTRNGQLLTNVDLNAGETFVVKESMTLTYTDNSDVAYEGGDKIMIVDDVASGSLIESKVNAVPANATGLSLINIGSSTVEIDANGHISVIDDSIDRSKLSSDLESDIDDKRSLTQNNAITSDSDTHIVTDATTGSSQNMYYRRTSNTSDPLSGTKRTVLGELYVASSGSGNPLAPSYAHTVTYSTHYTGTSTDMSMAIGGGNFEANVVNPSSAVYATGVYALAQSNQLGINSAVTGVAQNAGISNIGITGFGKAGGVGKDRGGVFALSDLDFLNYAGFRSASPISYPDVALIADAGTSATGKAFVAIGDSIFEGGTVTVPSAQSNAEAVNLGDIKAKEYHGTFNISSEDSEVINHNMGSKKILVSIWYNDELVTGSFIITKTENSVTILNQSSQAMVNVEICIVKLSV